MTDPTTSTTSTTDTSTTDTSTAGVSGRESRRILALEHGRSYVPGLLVVGAAVAVASGVSRLVPTVGPLTWAVLLGVLAGNAGLMRGAVEPGTRWATRRMLRFGVVLLGLQLAVPQVLGLGPALLGLVVACVVLTFFGTRWLGQRLGLSRGTSLMVATGFSICGASAIAAMEGVSDADDDDVATGIGLVTLCGTLAIFALPWLGALIGLTPEQYGIWAGASVHEVAQVVAAAAPVTGALAIAVVVKLTRVVLLAPMVAGQSLARRREGARSAGKRPPIIPLFVIGFLAMVVLRSVVPLPEGAVGAAKMVQDLALAAALFGLGAGVRISTLRRTGVRAVVLGMASWLLIGVVSLGGVLLLA
ncbi:MAG TPA: putative sulfate exporter family transporter [Actinomycetales bacterium]|nr:putative sulfate exporter family transporter [Actinomycetales bacterium]